MEDGSEGNGFRDGDDGGDVIRDIEVAGDGSESLMLLAGNPEATNEASMPTENTNIIEPDFSQTIDGRGDESDVAEGTRGASPEASIRPDDVRACRTSTSLDLSTPKSQEANSYASDLDATFVSVEEPSPSAAGLRGTPGVASFASPTAMELWETSVTPDQIEQGGTSRVQDGDGV